MKKSQRSTYRTKLYIGTFALLNFLSLTVDAQEKDNVVALATTCNNKATYNQIKIALTTDKSLAQKLAPVIAKNFVQFNQSRFCIKLIQKIVQIDNTHLQVLIKAAAQNILQTNPTILHFFTQYPTCKSFVQNALDDLSKNTQLPFDRMMTALAFNKIDGYASKLKLYSYASKLKKEKKSNYCQTEQHIINNFSFVVNNGCGTSTHQVYVEDPRLQNMIHCIIAKEKELQDKYYTFIHGQRWKYQFIEDWFAWLWEQKHKKKLDDFLFLHVRTFCSDISILQEESDLRKKILKNGRTSEEVRQRMLFMNYAFFANTNTYGSCSASYISNNSNNGTIHITPCEVFVLHNYEFIYKQFEKELIELQKLHASLSKYGNTLLIAIPKKTADHSVLCAKGGGLPHDPIAINGYKKPTNKLSLVMNALQRDASTVTDSDRIEFCLSMTMDTYGGLNPSSGIKIFQFNTVDQSVWRIYQEKNNALKEKIAHAIKEYELKEQSKQNMPQQIHEKPKDQTIWHKIQKVLKTHFKIGV